MSPVLKDRKKSVCNTNRLLTEELRESINEISSHMTRCVFHCAHFSRIEWSLRVWKSVCEPGHKPQWVWVSGAAETSSTHITRQRELTASLTAMESVLLTHSDHRPHHCSPYTATLRSSSQAVCVCVCLIKGSPGNDDPLKRKPYVGKVLKK